MVMFSMSMAMVEVTWELPRAKGRLQGSLGEVGEGLEELRERLWELWRGAGRMKFGRFEVQNRESGVRRCASG